MQKKSGYDGLAYRRAYETRNKWLSAFGKGEIILAGFNALTRSEEKIFKEMISGEKARIFWDADLCYLNPPFDAGKFIRKYRKDPVIGKNFQWEFDLCKPDKTFTLVHTTDDLSQVHYTIDQLLKIEREKKSPLERIRTAVVINDPGLLQLFLNALPAELEDINLTLSLPLNRMEISRFTDVYLRFYHRTEQNRRVDSELFLELISHPFFYKIYPSGQIETLKKKLIKRREKFIDKKEFFEIIHAAPDLAIFFPVPGGPEKITGAAELLVEKIAGRLDTYDPEKNAAIELHKVFRKLKEILQRFHLFEQTGTLLKFYRSLTKEISLAFEGKPLSGYQIMGLLETRTLDFDHVFLLSMNEGIVPKGKNFESFIPYDLRKFASLPVNEDKNAVTAYHIYRLISHARHIRLIYNASSQGLGAGEKSRIILQLREILPRYEIQMKEIRLNPAGETFSASTKTRKDPRFIEILRNYIQKKGVSASFLLSYLHYPKDFYQKFILQWDEPDWLESTIAANRMGEVIHKSMERIYTPYKNQILSREILKKLQREAPVITEKTFLEIYLQLDEKKIATGKYHPGGKNILALEAAKQIVLKFLSIDSGLLNEGKKLSIKDLERKIEFRKNLSNGTEAVFKGYLDRIDRIDGQIRVVDYKTGNVHGLTVKNPGEDLREGHKKYAFQLFFYLWLLHEGGILPDEDREPAAVIYTARNTRPQTLILPPEFSVQLKEFENFVFSLIEEILNPEIPFPWEPDAY
jgi:hypothetical protein